MDNERRKRRHDDSKEKITSLPWGRLWGYTKGQRWRFIIVTIATVIGALAGLLFPLLIGQGIGTVVESKSYTELNMLTLALLTVFAVQAFANYFQNYYLIYIGETVVYRMRQALYKKLLSLDMPFYGKHKSGELASRVSSDTSTVQLVFTQLAPSLLSSVISIVGTVIVMLSLNPPLTLFIFSIVPVMMVVMIFLGRLIQKMGTKNQDMLAANTGLATESIKNISVVKAFTAEEYEAERYDVSLRDVFGSMVHTGRLRSLNMSIIMLLAFSAIAAIVWFAGRQAIDGTLTLGLITTFLIYGLTMAMTFAQLSQIYAQMKQAAGSSRRVFEIIDQESVIIEPKNPKLVKNKKKLTIDVKGVNFSYGEVPALTGLNLTIEHGKIAALVGPSGAGKTTTFELLQRFYDPSAGVITMNGVDIRDINSHDLRNEIAVVSQNAPLFSGTVYDNIAYGNRTVNKKAVIEAAKAAQADEFIEKLENGYDTVLGESGVGLSGGQKQRIAIARAIIKNAPILLLDEATSALDTKSERLVQRALDELMKGRTTLVIAHRLSTIENADTIFVMADGSVVEKGSHKQLLAQNGLYGELYSQQKLVKESTDGTAAN
ncbi:MAG: ABC transporter ATP-binding protein [Candidatus Microsaccharimonas sp.]